MRISIGPQNYLLQVVEVINDLAEPVAEGKRGLHLLPHKHGKFRYYM